MEEFRKSGTATKEVAAVDNINTKLDSYEGIKNEKPVFKNVVTNQKDITIDLSVFLEDYQPRKFFSSNNEETKEK